MSNQTPPWRPADNQEVRTYYEHEFPEYVDRLPEWITPTAPKEFAIALTKRYPVVEYDNEKKNKQGRNTRPFIRRSTRTEAGPRFNDWDNLIKFFTEPVYNDPKKGDEPPNPGLVDPDSPKGMNIDSVPVADAVYYKLDNHERFWVLAFDIDAKDVATEAYRTKDDERRQDTILQQSGVKDQPPRGKSDPFYYRYEDVSRAISMAFDLKEWLHERCNFTDVRVLYSGQGAHVYALDDDPLHQYTQQTRKALMEYLPAVEGIPLDTKVTADDERVMRVPYSLHTDVSRTIVPIESPDFDFRTDPRVIPDYLND